jgi:hypothetical protein
MIKRRKNYSENSILVNKKKQPLDFTLAATFPWRAIIYLKAISRYYAVPSVPWTTPRSSTRQAPMYSRT